MKRKNYLLFVIFAISALQGFTIERICIPLTRHFNPCNELCTLYPAFADSLKTIYEMKVERFAELKIELSITQNGRYRCVIDINKDNDFTNDYAHFFEKTDSINKKEIGMLQPYFYTENNQLRNVWIAPILIKKDSCNYDLFLGCNESYDAHFTCKGNDYNLVIKTIGGHPWEYMCYNSNLSTRLPKAKSFKRNCTIIGNTCIEIDSIDFVSQQCFLNVDLIDSTNTPIGVDEGFMHPITKIQDVNGKVTDFHDFDGKFVLINFWGTWCRPCIAELPKLSRLNKKYEKVSIVSVANKAPNNLTFGFTPLRLKDIIKKYKMNWTNIDDGSNVDVNSLAKLFEIESYPTSILIAPDGTIIFRGEGVDALNEIEIKLDKCFR